MRIARIAAISTSSALSALALLHVGWAAGASFPFRDRTTMADATAGTQEPPLVRDCLAVAGLLGVAAELIADRVPFGGSVAVARMRRVGVAGVATVLGVRGALGVLGQTQRAVPWTPSAQFVRLDRRVYGPLCLALAAGSAASR